MSYPTAHLDGVLADRDSWQPTRCSIGRALDVVGTRSAMMLLREAYYGAHRFEEFTRRTGLTDAVAASRLKELVTVGVLAKFPYREPGQRTRSEYALTPMGTDLLPAILALMRWGDTYLSDDGGPIALRHQDCGAPVEVHVTCAEGHPVPLNELSLSHRAHRR